MENGRKIGPFPKWFSGLKVIVLLGVNANEIECAAVIARMYVSSLLSIRIWVENFDDMILFMSTPFEIRAHNLKILYLTYFFPKGFPQKKNTKSEKNLSHHLLGPSSVHSPLIAPKPIWNTTLIMLEDIPTFTTRTYYYYTTLWRRRKQGWKVSAEPSWGWRLQPTYNSSTSLYCSV